MNNLLMALHLHFCAAVAGVRGCLVNEAKRLRSDERGMELLQLILIIVIVIVVAVALWAVLGPVISDLLEQIETPEFGGL